MSTTTTIAKASAVSRALTSAGLRKAVWNASGMVRGWGEYSPGVKSEQDMKTGRERVRRGTYRDGRPRYTYVSNNEALNRVFVTYEHGAMGRSRGQEERLAVETEYLDKAAAILEEKGYTVTKTDGGGSMRHVVLEVTR